MDTPRAAALALKGTDMQLKIEHDGKTIQIGQLWKHEKTGNIYAILFIANSEGDNDPEKKEKYPVSITYANVAQRVFNWIMADGPVDPIGVAASHGAADVKVWNGRLDDWFRRMTLWDVSNSRAKYLQRHIANDVIELMATLGQRDAYATAGLQGV